MRQLVFPTIRDSRVKAEAVGLPWPSLRSHTPLVTSAGLHCGDIDYPHPMWEKTMLQCQCQEGRVKQTTVDTDIAGQAAI